MILVLVVLWANVGFSENQSLSIYPKTSKVSVWNIPGITEKKFKQEWGVNPANSPKLGVMNGAKEYLVLDEKTEDVYSFNGEQKATVQEKSFYKIFYGDSEGWVEASEVSAQKNCNLESQDTSNNKSIVRAAVRSEPSKIKNESDFNKYFAKHVCDQKGNKSKVACERFDIYSDVVKQAAKSFDLPHSSMACIITRESRWDWNADKQKIKNVASGKSSKIDAWGAGQIKEITARDVRNRLLGKTGTTHGEPMIQKFWSEYLKEVSQFSSIPGVEAAANYANIKALKKDAKYITSYKTLVENTPVNVGVQAAHFRRVLYVLGVDEGDKPSMNQLTMAAGMYNRGERTFKKLCNGLTAGECINMSRLKCNEAKAKGETDGWYEGHRYMMGVRNCLQKGNQNSYHFKEGECP